MFSITSRKISTGSKFELTKGHFYMEGCPPLPPRGVKAITTISIRKVSKREYLPMYIDTVCLPGISVVTVTTTRSFGGGGGGVDLTMNRGFFVFYVFIQSISDQSSVLLFNQEVLGKRTARTTTASRKTAI